jgi:UDP-N-acetylmuramoyl-L-alanine---L-glutamate ligase
VVSLEDLGGRTVALLGLGADVRAAVPHVRAAGPSEMLVVEEGGTVDLDELGRGPGMTVSAVSLDEAAARADVIVRSPGYPRYQPALVDALERGATMTTPLDLWLGTHGATRRDGSPRTVVAITGTKGKSTATELVSVLAGRAGLRVGVAGNLGVPVFADGWDADAPVVVLEVSSYQAADLHHAPDVAVVTFLAEDHLSWHGGVERYVADKLRVVRNDGGTAGRVLVPTSAGTAHAALEALGVTAEVVAAPVAPELPAHRVQNAALAAAVVAAVGGPVPSDRDIVDAARTSLPGRLDACPGPDGVLCLDDTLASNPSATAAGLAWVRTLGVPTVLLLGGTDRGVDPAPLVAEVARWVPDRLRIVALPDSGEHLATVVGVDPVATATDVADAVRLGLADLSGVGDHPLAAGSTAPRGPRSALVFSPAAPTPPRIGTWATRSAQFRDALRP